MSHFLSVSRRDLLKGVAGGGLALVTPMAFPSTARATGRAGTHARRILIVHLSGGVRSSAAFLASARPRYNPYGLIAGLRTPFAIGSLLDDHVPSLREAPLADSEYKLKGAWRGLRVPRLREMAGAFSVVGTWDPARGDHVQDRIKAPTGSAGGDDPGILTRIGAGLGASAGSGDIPAFHIEPTALFGKGGRIARYVPVTLVSPRSLPEAEGTGSRDAAADTGHDWSESDVMRSRLDDELLARSGRAARGRVSTFAVHRAAAARIGAKLAAPWINVASAEARTAAQGKVDISPGRTGAYVDLTSEMLYELFTRAIGATDPTEHALFPSAMNAAIAVRLLQLGSRAVCVENGNYDYHSDELRGRDLYRFLGRLWATLHFLLERIPDPEAPGKTMLDTTLVMTMSDFGRDPGPNGRRYNGGGGVDHGNDPSTYYLAHAVMGGGARGGRLLSAVSTDDYRADRIPERYDPKQLLATALWAIGLDPRNPQWGFEDAAPIAGLFE